MIEEMNFQQQQQQQQNSSTQLANKLASSLAAVSAASSSNSSTSNTSRYLNLNNLNNMNILLKSTAINAPLSVNLSNNSSNTSSSNNSSNLLYSPTGTSGPSSSVSSSSSSSLAAAAAALSLVDALSLNSSNGHQRQSNANTNTLSQNLILMQKAVAASANLNQNLVQFTQQHLQQQLHQQQLQQQHQQQQQQHHHHQQQQQQQQQQAPTCNLNNTLFVGNLHASLQEIDLIQVFRPFGNIVECCKKWLHFGFVKFTTEEEACHAYVTLNGYRLKGRPMRLEFQNRTKKARIKAIIAQATLQAAVSTTAALTQDGFNLGTFQLNDDRQMHHQSHQNNHQIQQQQQQQQQQQHHHNHNHHQQLQQNHHHQQQQQLHHNNHHHQQQLQHQQHHLNNLKNSFIYQSSLLECLNKKLEHSSKASSISTSSSTATSSSSSLSSITSLADTNNLFNTDQLIKFASGSIDLESGNQTSSGAASSVGSSSSLSQINHQPFEFNFDLIDDCPLIDIANITKDSSACLLNIPSSVDSNKLARSDELLMNLVKKTIISPIESPPPQHDLSSSNSSDSGCRSASFLADCDDSAIISTKQQKSQKSSSTVLSKQTSFLSLKQLNNDDISLSEHLEFTCSKSIKQEKGEEIAKSDNQTASSVQSNSDVLTDQGVQDLDGGLVSNNENENDNDDCDSDCDTSDDASEFPLDADCLNDLDLAEYANDIQKIGDFSDLVRYGQVIDKDGTVAKRKLKSGCIYRSVNQTMSLFIEPNDVLKQMDLDEFDEYFLFPSEDDEEQEPEQERERELLDNEDIIESSSPYREMDSQKSVVMPMDPADLINLIW